MSDGSKTYVPGGAGGLQGIRAGAASARVYDPLDVTNDGFGRHDVDRIGGTNSRAQVTSKNSKGSTFRGKARGSTYNDHDADD